MPKAVILLGSIFAVAIAASTEENPNKDQKLQAEQIYPGIPLKHGELTAPSNSYAYSTIAKNYEELRVGYPSLADIDLDYDNQIRRKPKGRRSHRRVTYGPRDYTQWGLGRGKYGLWGYGLRRYGHGGYGRRGRKRRGYGPRGYGLWGYTRGETGLNTLYGYRGYGH